MVHNVSELTDISAESGVIASIIYHPEFLLSDNNLQPRFFYHEENQMMYWAINELVSKGVTKIDNVNLNNILYSDKHCMALIERYGLGNLQNYINIARAAARDTFEEYRLLANTVISLAFRRELYSLSVGLGKECFNMEFSLDDLNDYVNNGIDTVAQKFVLGSDTVQFAEKIDSVWAEICNDRNDDGSFGIPNLIPTLNDYYTFGKGELVLVAGATGKGKSSLMLNQAVYTLSKGIPCVIIDTELTDKVFLPRMLANLSGVEVKKIKCGTYTNDEEAKVKKAIEAIKKSPGFVHEYQPIFSKLQIDQICRKWYNKNKLGFLVYDYIKPSGKMAAEISQGMGLIADYLKSVAGNLNIPVMAGLQLNRITGDLADSLKTERYADVLLFWKEKTADQVSTDGLQCGNFMMQVIKNRNGSVHGETQYVDIMFKGDFMSIYEAEKHKNQPSTPFGDNKKG